MRRDGGFIPKLTDPEVITIKICGEYLQQPTDKVIFRYFRSRYPHFLPLLTDRTVFVREAANLWQISELIQQQIVEGCGQRTANWQIIDTLPVPICRNTRAKRRVFQAFEADYGYCAAKFEYYYGFKLGLRVSLLGMIVHYPLLQARSHDVRFLEELVGEFRGDRIADKGFLDQWWRQQLQKPRRLSSDTNTPKPEDFQRLE